MQTFPRNKVTAVTSSELPASWCIFCPSLLQVFCVVGIPQMVPTALKEMLFPDEFPRTGLHFLDSREILSRNS